MRLLKKRCRCNPTQRSWPLRWLRRFPSAPPLIHPFKTRFYLALSLTLLLGACSGTPMVIDPAHIYPEQLNRPEPLAEYRVSKGRLEGNPSTEHLAVWERFTTLFHPSIHPEITKFSGFDALASGGIDGLVTALDDGSSEWELMLDVTSAYSSDYADRTMLHEFAHIMTLRKEQVPPDLSMKYRCESFFTGEGCPAAESYIYEYAKEFWPKHTWDINEFEKDADRIARWETGEFVTYYSTTSPTEDIAEVFSEWVLADEQPTGNAVLKKKLQFFDRYPEVRAVRQKTRKALGLSTK